MENAVTVFNEAKEGKRSKSVTVYSARSFSWCNTLKGYSGKDHVPFTDIDVSGDEPAASETVRSGRHGVSQTLINGEIVTGFDKKKPDRFLEIEAG